MPPPTSPLKPLSSYKVLSFDVYGTLIEYKPHILSSFHLLLSRLPANSKYLTKDEDAEHASSGSITFLRLFQSVEDKIKLERPVKRFDELLREMWTRISKELGVETNEKEAQKFGESIPSWPVFEGTLDALQRLGKRYKLIALSNIDRYAWSRTSALQEVNWWKVITADDFDLDAPDADMEKLRFLLDNVGDEEILHVAQSLGHDHAPAKKMGLNSVWLVGDGGRWGKEGEWSMVLEREMVGYGWRFETLKDFADAVERGDGELKMKSED
jgi:FMN phosphatase YigB (HAD superfamily)